MGDVCRDSISTADALSPACSRSLYRTLSEYDPNPQDKDKLWSESNYTLSCEGVVSQIARSSEEIKCCRANLGPVEVEKITVVLKDPSFNTYLKRLNLSCNHIGIAGIKCLASTLTAATAPPNLEFLSLEKNNLNPEAGLPIANIVRANLSIRRFHLSRNELRGTGIQQIAEALKQVSDKCVLRELDVSSNKLDAAAGIQMAEAMLLVPLRKLDIRDNDFPSDVRASIEAALSFSCDVWSGNVSLEAALEEARRLCPRMHVSSLSQMPEYLEAIVRFWPNEGTAKHIVAALLAPIVVRRVITDRSGPRIQVPQFDHAGLQLMADIYIPNSEQQLSLPEGNLLSTGLFILNLTPFRVSIMKTSVSPCSAALSGQVASGDPLDLSIQHHLQNETKRFLLRVGDEGFQLQPCNDEESGLLRILTSCKEYPATSHMPGTFVHMVTIVWSPPAKLGGVPLCDLRACWEQYLLNQPASRKALPALPDMYNTVESWIKPHTAVSQGSFASLMRFDYVDTFVSHYWGSPLDNMFESLEKHSRGKKDTRVWICSIANNQWRICDEVGGVDLDKSTFRQALACKRCTAMALMLDFDGAPLTRFWCLFEIMTVIELRKNGHGLELDLCTPHGVINRGEMHRDHADKIARMVGDIDVEQARCSKEQDKRRIETAILKRIGGYRAMDDMIRVAVSQGLMAIEERDRRLLERTVKRLMNGRQLRSRSKSTCEVSNLADVELRAEVTRLRFEVASQESSLSQQEKELTALRAENAKLKSENTQMKAIVSKVKQSDANARWLETRRGVAKTATQ